MERATNPNLNNFDEDSEDEMTMPELEDRFQEEQEDCSDLKKYDLDVSSKDDDFTQLDVQGYEDVLGSGRLRRKILECGVSPNCRPSTGFHVTVKYSIKNLQDVELIPEETVEFVLSESEVFKTLDFIVPLMNKLETDEVIAEADFLYGSVGLIRDSQTLIQPNLTCKLIVKLEDFADVSDVTAIPLPERQAIGKRKKDRGNFWYSRGDHTEAIQNYRKAAEYFDDERIELEVPADRYLLSQELQELVQDRIKVYNNLAQAQMKIEAFDSALASLRQVLKIDPNNEKALYRKAKILMDKGSIEEAVGLLKRVTRLYEKNAQAKIDLARLQNKRKKQRSNDEKMSKKMLGLDKYEKEKDEEKKKWKKRTMFLGLLSGIVGLSAVIVYKFV